MRVDIVTIFPDMVKNAASCSIVGRAQTAGFLDLHVHDLRDWAKNKHRATDDSPFGGGAGMVMTPPPLFACLEAVTQNTDTPIILMAPDGERFDQKMARELSVLPRFVLLCGHYEGIDERVRQALVTREISVGDYVLTGGELPALTILDATTRLLPGVLGNANSIADESFSGHNKNAEDGETEEILLEYPHYTRPADFRGMIVPGVLLSGHHANIVKWQRGQALLRTRARRPDLWANLLPLSAADEKLLAEAEAETAKN